MREIEQHASCMENTMGEKAALTDHLCAACANWRRQDQDIGCCDFAPQAGMRCSANFGCVQFEALKRQENLILQKRQ